MSKYMPDSNGRRKHEKLDKDQLREATFEFLDHVKSHNDVPFHAAIVLAISDDMDDRNKQHMCQFAGGEPEVLATMLINVIDEMIENVAGFRESFEEQMRMRLIMKTVAGIADELRGRAEKHAEEVELPKHEGAALDALKRAMAPKDGAA